MRVSNISQYLGGADNVKVEEYIQGSKFSKGGVVSVDGTPIDITSFTLTANVEYYMATAIVAAGRGAGAEATVTLTSFELIGDSHPDRSLTINKLNSSEGEFEVLIPEDLYEDDGTVLDATTIPVAVAYVYFDDGNDFKEPFRYLLLVRRGVPSIS